MEKIKISQIKKCNRPIKEDVYDDLLESIRRLGQVHQILVHKVEDRFEIMDGHHRVEVFKELGIEEIYANVF